MNDLRELELMSEIASLKDKCNTYANQLINLAIENKRLTEFATKYGEKKMELLMENEALRKRIKELEEIATKYGDQKIAALLENEMLRERIKELELITTIETTTTYEFIFEGDSNDR